jgi:ketosteroid isomerase-like protein
VGANAEQVKSFVEAWNKGDLSPVLQNAAPDMEWVVAREHPAATTHRGPEEISSYFEDWYRTMPEMEIEIEELIENGDRVLAVMRIRGAGAGSGATTEVRVATVTTFRGGQTVRTEEFLDADEARQRLTA